MFHNLFSYLKKQQKPCIFQVGAFLLSFIVPLIVVGYAQPDFHGIFSLLAYLGAHAIFWLYLLQNTSRKKHRFFLGILWFSGVQCIQLFWFNAFDYHGFYIVFAYLFLAIFMGLQYGLLMLLLPQSKQDLTNLHVLSLASAWTLFEWVRLFIFCGFAFNPLGLALGGSQVTLQLASLVGILGMTFWVIWVNGLGLRLMIHRNPLEVFFYVGIASFPVLFGLINISWHGNEKNHALKHEVVLVQPGLRMEEKNIFMDRIENFIDPFRQWEMIFSYIPQDKKIDFIVLPEAAVPFGAYSSVYPIEIAVDVLQKHFGQQIVTHLPLYKPYVHIDAKGQETVNNAFFVKTLANHSQADVIIGMDCVDEKIRQNYNAAFYFSPDRLLPERYEKQVLVPVGEYIPFKLLRKITAKYGIENFFSPGPGSKVFQGKKPFSISICYEECFSHIIRQGKKLGAHLFINLTNDAYYPNTRLPRVHFDLGKIRAIENGVPVLRSCNNGVTSCIDCLGKAQVLQNESGDFEWVKGSLATSISQYHYKTLYSLIGNYLIIGVSVIVFCIFLLFSLRKVFLSKEKKLRIS